MKSLCSKEGTIYLQVGGHNWVAPGPIPLPICFCDICWKTFSFLPILFSPGNESHSVQCSGHSASEICCIIFNQTWQLFPCDIHAYAWGVSWTHRQWPQRVKHTFSFVFWCRVKCFTFCITTWLSCFEGARLHGRESFQPAIRLFAYWKICIVVLSRNLCPTEM